MMVEPRGQVATVAGRSFHWRQHQGSAPPVVLMSGCGLAMEYWRGVSEALADVRVIVYDRPGMGGTRWPGRLPTLAEEVDSLAALLRQLDASPAVLVAHSMAAFHAEALARLHPELVAAVVMVDGSVERYTAAPGHRYDALPGHVFELLRMLRLGRLAGLAWRLGTWLQSDWDFRRLGRGRLESIYRDRNALAMATAESIAYPRQAWDLQQLRRHHPWPAVPAVVLTAGSQRSWRRRQARWAASLGARQVQVAGSKHLMMLDRPQAIVEAVRQVRSAVAGVVQGSGPGQDCGAGPANDHEQHEENS